MAGWESVEDLTFEYRRRRLKSFRNTTIRSSQSVYHISLEITAYSPPPTLRLGLTFWIRTLLLLMGRRVTRSIQRNWSLSLRFRRILALSVFEAPLRLHTYPLSFKRAGPLLKLQLQRQPSSSPDAFLSLSSFFSPSVLPSHLSLLYRRWAVLSISNFFSLSWG